MGDTNERSCLPVFAWIIGTLVFVVMLSLTFRVAVPILLGDNETSHIFDKTTQLNDEHTGNTIPPELIKSTSTNSFDTRFVTRLGNEHQLTPDDTSIDDEEFAPVRIRIPNDRLTEIERYRLFTKVIFDVLRALSSEDRSAYTVPNHEDVAPLPMDSKTAVATTIEPQLNETTRNDVVVSANESAVANPIIDEVVLLHDTPRVTFQTEQTTVGTLATTVTLPSFEVEAEVTPEISSTLERYDDVSNDLIQQTTVLPFSADEIVNTAVLSSPIVTAVIKRPAPFPNFVFSKNKRPLRPLLTAEKVSTQYSYEFFREPVSYAKSVEICRQIGQGSRLLSIEAGHEERIVDAYVKSHQKDIFGYTEEYSRYMWTGGYFDLESHLPYELRWVDHPKPMEASSYWNFCPESKDVHLVIDQALSLLKAQTFGASNLNPCDRRWAHVILDFTGHRIGRSCWQILDRDILSADDWMLPFICKR